jgi:bacterial/archaeal transporter family-2 protein
MAGEIVHYEVMVSDGDRAQAFWGGLFGWQFGPPMSPEMDYRMAQIDEKSGAALSATGTPKSHPNVYLATDDIDASIREGARARRQRGGQVAGTGPRLVLGVQGPGGRRVPPLAGRRVRRISLPGPGYGWRVSGSGVAVGLSVLAGLAGAVQVALMSQLGDRISIAGALAFATLFTAVASFVILVIARRSVSAYVDAFHQPWWILMGGLMGLLIVFTITYAGPRIGTAPTLGILIAGQLVMGAAIDKWGLFGSDKVALHWPRVTGIVLLAIGSGLSLKN